MLKTRLLFLIFIVFTGCTKTIVNTSQPVSLGIYTKIAVIPFTNNTEIPMAGRRAMSIAAVTLKTRGFSNIETYTYNEEQNVLLPGIENKPDTRAKQLQWAKNHGARYLMTGNVNEWSYKVGLDGEPVVGLSLQLIDLKQNKTIWSAVGSKSGGSRVAITTIAQQLLNSMLKGVYPVSSSHA